MHHLTLLNAGPCPQGQAFLLNWLQNPSRSVCCTSNALGGTEDDLWDDDEDDSNVDDPSSDYLPSDSDDAGEDEDSA